MTDQIADLLTRIRNACLVGKYEITLPYSKMKEVILQILKNEGFVSEVKVITKKDSNQKSLKVNISDVRIPRHIKQISKPGQRIYVKSKDIPKPLRGLGLVIISTSTGITTGRDAVKKGLGGEIICEVW